MSAAFSPHTYSASFLSSRPPSSSANRAHSCAGIKIIGIDLIGEEIAKIVAVRCAGCSEARCIIQIGEQDEGRRSERATGTKEERERARLLTQKFISAASLGTIRLSNIEKK